MSAVNKRLLVFTGMALLIGAVLFPAVAAVLGHGPWTATVCLVILLAIGYSALRAEDLSLRQVGGSLRDFAQAIGVLLAAYAVFSLLLMLFQRSGSTQLRAGLVGFSLYAWFDNWVLTGFSEELLFRGYLLTSLRQRMMGPGGAWFAALVSSAGFSLYHLPFSLWLGQTGTALAMDLAMPFISSLLVFVPAYVLSGNLWLAAFLHGVTDYPVVRAIKDQPLWGLVFMALAITLGWAVGSVRKRSRPGASSAGFPGGFIYGRV